MKAKELFRRAAAILTALAISLSLTVYSGTAVVNADSTQAQLESELKDIKNKQKEIDKAIKDTKGDISREKENQEKIDEQIKTTEEYIRTLTDLIKEYNSQIEGLELDVSQRQAEISDTEALIEQERQEIDSSIEVYEKQLRAMYISGGDSYAAILLGATDFFDMLMKMELVKRVAGSNNEFIANLLSVKDSYEQNKAYLEDKVTGLENAIAEVDSKKAEVEALKADWDNQLSDLEDLYSESKAEIKALEDRKKVYEENKEELEKEAEKREKEIEELIRKAARSEYIGDLEPGTFLWPLPGYPTITSPYGSRWGDTHRGIDIAGKDCKGAEITAANSGVVIKVNNSCTHNYYKEKSCGCGGGFGNYCIIDHGGGYTTLYAHATKITVKEGQHVTTGDVIGTVGSTGYAMGYHLHFEVRVNGERKDPESFNLLPY
mgnify:FL=1